jgi:hypothetical protein
MNWLFNTFESFNLLPLFIKYLTNLKLQTLQGLESEIVEYFKFRSQLMFDKHKHLLRESTFENDFFSVQEKRIKYFHLPFYISLRIFLTVANLSSVTIASIWRKRVDHQTHAAMFWKEFNTFKILKIYWRKISWKI